MPPTAAGRTSEARRRPRRDPNPDGKLTPQQQRFCAEYLLDLSPQRAAIRAGYSAKTAHSQGSQVLSLPKVQTRIAELQAERLRRNAIDADFVLRRLVEEVNADAGDLYDDNGRLLPVKQWPEVLRRGLVSSIRTTTLYGRGAMRDEEIGETTEVVLVDRVRRLELLGKHVRINAFSDKVTVGVDSPLQQLFRQIQGNVLKPGALIEHELPAQLDVDPQDEGQE
jgi:phage terminase small subunit